MSGFNLTVENQPQLVECDRAQDFFIQFYILLSKQQERPERYDDFINKCFLEMEKNFLVLLNLSPTDLQSIETFERYLKSSGSSEELTKKALEIYKLKRKKIIFDQVVKKFSELTLLDLKGGMTPENYKKLYSYLKIVESFDKDHPLRHFFELAVALRSDNPTWVKKISKQIVNSSTLQYAIFMDPKEIKRNNEVQLIESLFSTLKLMKSVYKEEMILKILATRLSSILPTKYKEKFDQEFGTNWSLNELREVVRNRKYGQFAVGLWFNILENRTTEAEVNRFLDNILKRSALRKLPKQEYWILKYFYPGDERRIEIERKLALMIKDKPQIHDKLIISEILEREAIKKTLAKIQPALGNPLFKVKRELYKEVLSTGAPSQFALYNLFLLGEKDPELFWWFVL